MKITTKKHKKNLDVFFGFQKICFSLLVFFGFPFSTYILVGVLLILVFKTLLFGHFDLLGVQ